MRTPARNPRETREQYRRRLRAHGYTETQTYDYADQFDWSSDDGGLASGLIDPALIGAVVDPSSGIGGYSDPSPSYDCSPPADSGGGYSDSGSCGSDSSGGGGGGDC